MPGVIDFKKVMEARRQAQQAEAEKAKAEPPAAYVDPEATLPVCSFTDEGLARVTDLLRKMRIEETVLQDDVDVLVNDIEYLRQLDENIKINPGKIFKTKLELCEYFTKIFTSDFLATHRRDKGLWTWLAMVYFKQFVKAKNNIAKIFADARWVFEPINYRFARRHFIAGTVYLFQSIGGNGEDVNDMFFSGKVNELSRFVDVLTYLPECVRNPSFLLVAVKFYYDPFLKAKVKRGAFNKGNAWSLWQYLRVYQQLSETHDFSDKEDMDKLMSVLPAQFNCLRTC